MNSEDGVGGSVGSGAGERRATPETSNADAEAGAGTGTNAATAGADATADGDGGYVHRPESATPPADADAGGDVTAATTGVRGWVLVAVVVACFLVIPGVVYLRPAAPGRLGLPFLVAMLALPMLPALLLGLTAVWSMRGPRDRDGDEAAGADGGAHADGSADANPDAE